MPAMQRRVMSAVGRSRDWLAADMMTQHCWQLMYAPLLLLLFLNFFGFFFVGAIAMPRVIYHRATVPIHSDSNTRGVEMKERGFYSQVGEACACEIICKYFRFVSFVWWMRFRAPQDVHKCQTTSVLFLLLLLQVATNVGAVDGRVYVCVCIGCC